LSFVSIRETNLEGAPVQLKKSARAPLVAIAGALIMSPASYHRQTSPRAASAHFIRLGGRLLLTAMVPLLLGIGLDFYLIARVVLGSSGFAAAEAIGLVLFFALCWFELPRWGRRYRPR
jgi:hypothetical protein